MGNKLPTQPNNRSIEQRIADLEERLRKPTGLTVLAAFVAVLLGSGGVAGILTITSQKPMQNAEARLKQAEASGKELEVACALQAKGIEGLQKIIDGLNQKGDASKADSVRQIMLQQEADFQVFCNEMGQAMQGLYGSDRAAGNRCKAALAAAKASSLKRQEALTKLVQ